MDQMVADQDAGSQSDFSALASTIDEQEIINANLLRQLEVRRHQISRNRTIFVVSALAVIVLASGLVVVGIWSLGVAGDVRGHVDALVTSLSASLLSGIASILVFLKLWLKRDPALEKADYLIEKNRLALQLMHSAMERGRVAGRD